MHCIAGRSNVAVEVTAFHGRRIVAIARPLLAKGVVFVTPFAATPPAGGATIFAVIPHTARRYTGTSHVGIRGCLVGEKAQSHEQSKVGQDS